MLSPVFDQFAKKSPVPVMARGMMERVLNPEQLGEWFATIADQQYTRDLLFSTVFDLMSQVVRGSHRSVHAAYQANKEDISVSITSVYNKLNGIENAHWIVFQQMTALKLSKILKELAGAGWPRCENGWPHDFLPGIPRK